MSHQLQFEFVADCDPAELEWERMLTLDLLHEHYYDEKRGVALANKIAKVEGLPEFGDCSRLQMRALRTAIRREFL